MLAKRLKKARLEAGLSTRALGELIGVSFSSIARIERGEGKPTVHSAERIERWLKDGTGSEPVRRTAAELSRMDRMELKLIHLDGIVTGLLARVAHWEGK